MSPPNVYTIGIEHPVSPTEPRRLNHADSATPTEPRTLGTLGTLAALRTGAEHAVLLQGRVGL
jgi:hypothetical protein